MSIEPKNYISRANYLENIVTEDLKKAGDYAAMANFFYDAATVSGAITLGSLLYGDKQITLLCGLTTTLTILANSYFANKGKSIATVADVLNGEVEALKKHARTLNEKIFTNQIPSPVDHPQHQTPSTMLI